MIIIRDKIRIAREWLSVLNPRSRIHESKIIENYKKFIFSWISFVFILKNFGNGSEPSMINNLLKHHLPKDFSKTFYHYNKKNIEKLSELSVYNVKFDRSNEADKLNESIDSRNVDDILKSVIFVLYVIRCNLFHGDKSWSEKRDNEVIGVSAPILIYIVENLLKEIKS